ncbi:MAG TPA: hypothetical protein PKD54_07175 [Pirellulaceae bacterium]|nr:hypothetical protein [Pirellulaceae bacterium]
MAHRLSALTPDVRDTFVEMAGLTYSRQQTRSLGVPVQANPISTQVAPTPVAPSSMSIGDSVRPSR